MFPQVELLEIDSINSYTGKSPRLGIKQIISDPVSDQDIARLFMKVAGTGKWKGLPAPGASASKGLFALKEKGA